MLDLEPIIGNHNQEFLDNWYDKLKSFSFSMMETIFQFCDKAIAENKIEISNCGQILKKSMIKEDFNEIEETKKQMKRQQLTS